MSHGGTGVVARSSLFAALLLCACQTTTPSVVQTTAPSVVHSVYRAQGAKEYCPGGLSIHLEQTQRAVAFLAENACHVPLFVELSFSRLENAKTSEPLPVGRSLPPNSKSELLWLEQINPRDAWPFEWKVSTFLGSSPPRPDPDYRYAFPFGGPKPRRLIQGVDGKLTHQGLHRFAFDFEMPIGTPVLAARDGIVLFVRDGFGAGRFEEKYLDRSNGVWVLHPDGSIADYGHLSAGIRVEEGSRVETGDLLGFSGNSGYVRDPPHLHFAVSEQRRGAKSQSIEIWFRGDVVPVEGGVYGPYPGGDSTARDPF